LAFAAQPLYEVAPAGNVVFASPCDAQAMRIRSPWLWVHHATWGTLAFTIALLIPDLCW
jgi:hypothetical protein